MFLKAWLRSRQKVHSLCSFQPKRHVHNNSNDKLSMRGSYLGFSFKYDYPHVIPLAKTAQIFGESHNDNGDIKSLTTPLAGQIRRRYDNIDPSVMWSTFVSSKSAFEKGIMRSLHRKRLRRAFFAALEDQRLDRNGMPLDEIGRPIPGAKSPIRGSIVLRVLPNFPGVPMSTLKANCVKVIKQLSGNWT
jgi:hypothetical protein